MLPTCGYFMHARMQVLLLGLWRQQRAGLRHQKGTASSSSSSPSSPRLHHLQGGDQAGPADPVDPVAVAVERAPVLHLRAEQPAPGGGRPVEAWIAAVLLMQKRKGFGSAKDCWGMMKHESSHPVCSIRMSQWLHNVMYAWLYIHDVIYNKHPFSYYILSVSHISTSGLLSSVPDCYISLQTRTNPWSLQTLTFFIYSSICVQTLFFFFIFVLKLAMTSSGIVSAIFLGGIKKQVKLEDLKAKSLRVSAMDISWNYFAGIKRVHRSRSRLN